MSAEFILGILSVTLAGLILGSGAWPMKLMKQYRFEHWWFVGMLVGLVILPWSVALTGCPHFFAALRSVPWNTLAAANLWAAGWGVANVLCGLCFVRIGMALTTALLTGLGASIGVILPMIVKGSGLFHNAGGLTSPAGMTIVAGVVVMLSGVSLTAAAGFGRERAPRTGETNSGSFLAGLLMSMLAGILSSGLSLAFVYGQGPIVEAMKGEGAGEIPANFAVWAVGLLAGALVSVIYPAWFMTRNKSWSVLLQSRQELLLASIIGLNMSVGVVLMGGGMLMLGALGASIGWGIQQATWMLGGQMVGFLSGEWRDVHGPPRTKMFLAVALLIVAVFILVSANPGSR